MNQKRSCWRVLHPTGRIKSLNQQSIANCKLKMNFIWVINNIPAASISGESQHRIIQAPWVVARAELADNSCQTGDI